MAALTTIALVSAGVAAVGTVASYNAQKRAAGAARSAAQTQIQQQRQQAQRQRRSAIRATLAQRAQMQAQAQAMGVSDSSALAGGQSGISSQLGSNLGFGSMMSGLSQQYTSLTGQAAQAGAQAQMFGTIADLGFRAFGATGGFGGGNKTPSLSGGSPPNYNYGIGGPQ